MRNPIVCYLEVYKTYVNVYGILPRFLKNLLEEELVSANAIKTHMKGRCLSLLKL